jgi:uncharacterized protein (TIGR01370 family)
MHLIKILLIVLAFFKIPGFMNAQSKADNNTLLVCYGKFDPKVVKGYDYVIVESKQFSKSEINTLKNNNKTVYAYISIAEVNVYADLYKELKGTFLGKNKNWDSFYLDLKSEKTRKAILKNISNLSDKGFTGIFLDNADNFSQFGFQKLQKKEAIELIKDIKKQFPKLSLIQNSGVELLKETATDIDAVMLESIFSNYSFQDKKYGLRTDADFEQHFKKVDDIRLNFRKNILLVEYADTIELYKQVSEKLKKHKFDYFIGKIDLQTIPNYNKTIQR